MDSIFTFEIGISTHRILVIGPQAGIYSKNSQSNKRDSTLKDNIISPMTQWRNIQESMRAEK